MFQERARKITRNLCLWSLYSFRESDR
jgi:hypothetical protein